MEFNFTWWVLAVEIPAFVGLFKWFLTMKQNFEESISEVKTSHDANHIFNREELAAYKLYVANNYVSNSYLKDVESRLTNHLLRIETKLDEVRGI